MTNGGSACQSLERGFCKNIGHKAHALVFVHAVSVKADNAGAFLPAVLLCVQTEISQTSRFFMVINAEYAAFVLDHRPYFFSFLRRCAMRLSMTDGLG